MRSNSAVALSSSLFSFCDDDELRQGFRRTGVRFTDRKRVRTFMRVGRFEKANEVARKLAREVIERGGGSGGGNNFYNVRARESGRLRFTHDTSEYGSEETMNSESLIQRTANTGNPGVMYARVENVNVNNQNWPYFQFGKRDATMSIMCAPPSSAKYYSYVTYVWRKTFGALGLRSLSATNRLSASEFVTGE